jgi:lysophospholipid acyltransferase (LPLAT)-like uncharacterized protein
MSGPNRSRRNLQRNETTNENWDAESKPILEAFWHAKYFIKMIKYAKDRFVSEPATG